jgi:hypothetical protein
MIILETWILWLTFSLLVLISVEMEIVKLFEQVLVPAKKFVSFIKRHINTTKINFIASSLQVLNMNLSKQAFFNFICHPQNRKNE